MADGFRREDEEWLAVWRTMLDLEENAAYGNL
jgi:hypothetical protein